MWGGNEIKNCVWSKDPAFLSKGSTQRNKADLTHPNTDTARTLSSYQMGHTLDLLPNQDKGF